MCIAKICYFKMVSFVISLIFSFTSVCLSSPSCYSIKVPENIGRVSSRYKTDSEKTLVIVQDAHGSFTAQKNLAHILNMIIPQIIPEDSKAIPFIGVEGALGEYDLKTLNSFPVNKAKEIISEEYVKEGKFIGAEYAHIIADDYFKLYGVEDKDLFKKHLESFYKVQKGLKDFFDTIQILNVELEHLKVQLFNKDLLGFDKDALAYEQGNINIISHISRIKPLCDSLRIDCLDYIAFMQFQEVCLLGNKVNHDVLGNEIEVLKKLIREKISNDKDGVSVIDSYFLEDKSKSDIVRYCVYVANKYGINLEPYKQICLYDAYLKKYALIDMSRLLVDIADINCAIRRALSTSDDELVLVDLSFRLMKISQLAKLKAIKEDVRVFRSNKDQYSLDTIANEISKFTNQVCPEVNNCDEHIMAIDDFYTFAEARDEAMLNSLLNKMNETGQNTGVLVAGGYHTSGLVELCKAKNISYLTITPHIDTIAEDAGYMERMMGRIAPFDPLMTSYLQVSQINAAIQAFIHMDYISENVWNQIISDAQVAMYGQLPLFSPEHIERIISELHERGEETFANALEQVIDEINNSVGREKSPDKKANAFIMQLQKNSLAIRAALGEKVKNAEQFEEFINLIQTTLLSSMNKPIEQENEHDKQLSENSNNAEPIEVEISDEYRDYYNAEIYPMTKRKLNSLSNSSQQLLLSSGVDSGLDEYLYELGDSYAKKFLNIYFEELLELWVSIPENQSNSWWAAQAVCGLKSLITNKDEKIVRQNILQVKTLFDDPMIPSDSSSAVFDNVLKETKFYIIKGDLARTIENMQALHYLFNDIFVQLDIDRGDDEHDKVAMDYMKLLAKKQKFNPALMDTIFERAQFWADFTDLTYNVPEYELDNGALIVQRTKNIVSNVEKDYQTSVYPNILIEFNDLPVSIRKAISITGVTDSFVSAMKSNKHDIKNTLVMLKTIIKFQSFELAVQHWDEILNFTDACNACTNKKNIALAVSRLIEDWGVQFIGENWGSIAIIASSSSKQEILSGIIGAGLENLRLVIIDDNNSLKTAEQFKKTGLQLVELANGYKGNYDDLFEEALEHFMGFFDVEFIKQHWAEIVNAQDISAILINGLSSFGDAGFVQDNWGVIYNACRVLKDRSKYFLEYAEFIKDIAQAPSKRGVSVSFEEIVQCFVDFINNIDEDRNCVNILESFVTELKNNYLPIYIKNNIFDIFQLFTFLNKSYMKKETIHKGMNKQITNARNEYEVRKMYFDLFRKYTDKLINTFNVVPFDLLPKNTRSILLAKQETEIATGEKLLAFFNIRDFIMPNEITQNNINISENTIEITETHELYRLSEEVTHNCELLRNLIKSPECQNYLQ